MLTVISGDHIRHYYFIKKLSEIVKIDNLIIEKREKPAN